MPGASNVKASKEVKKRFRNAIINNDRLYVPFVCICELGNHIAHVQDGAIRRNLALKLIDTVRSSINDGNPWTITPSEGLSELLTNCREFESYCEMGIGLTDTLVIIESVRLKKRYSGLGYSIHIWTMDKAIKSHEPEKEEAAFLG